MHVASICGVPGKKRLHDCFTAFFAFYRTTGATSRPAPAFSVFSDSLVGIGGGGESKRKGKRGGEAGESRAGDGIGRSSRRRRKRGDDPKLQGRLANGSQVSCAIELDRWPWCPACSLRSEHCGYITYLSRMSCCKLCLADVFFPWFCQRFSMIIELWCKLSL